ncbi:MAG: peptidase M14, partial [marine benthic group bacterium]|nr:peptidase M14 [Candidatus Benthicola marisminoris]
VSTDRTDLPLGERWSPPAAMAPPPFPSATDAAAYLVEWDGLSSARLLVRLQNQGLRCRITTRGFTVLTSEGERAFGPGVLLIPAQQSGVEQEATRDLVMDAARSANAKVYAAATALTLEGPDLGTGSALALEPPAVALLTGSGASSTRTGETWEFLTATLGVPVSLLDLTRLEHSDLDRYGVIVFAGGSAQDSALVGLGKWIEDGGRLVALGSAVDDVTNAELIQLTPRPFNLDSLTADVRWSDRSVARAAHFVGGAILLTELDPTHPLAYGIGDALPTFRSSSDFYDALPGDAVGRYSEFPVLAGYVSNPRRLTIPGSVAVAASRKGRGAVIVILDEPVFRGFWLGSARLLANAVFLGGSF